MSLTELLTGEHLRHLLHTWGYGAVAAAVGLEALGLPLPGEITLVSAALYAGATHRMDIALVVLTAAAAAVMGSNAGYLIGRALDVPLLQQYGWRIGLSETRLVIGRRLFARHGAKVVLFGRFIVVLRSLAALLAGALEMPFAPFLIANVAGGVVWASIYGFGAYELGERIERIKGPMGLGLGVAAALGFVAAVLLARRHERRVTEQARSGRMVVGSK